MHLQIENPIATGSVGLICVKKSWVYEVSACLSPSKFRIECLTILALERLLTLRWGRTPFF